MNKIKYSIFFGLMASLAIAGTISPGGGTISGGSNGGSSGSVTATNLPWSALTGNGWTGATGSGSLVLTNAGAGVGSTFDSSGGFTTAYGNFSIAASGAFTEGYYGVFGNVGYGSSAGVFFGPNQFAQTGFYATSKTNITALGRIHLAYGIDGDGSGLTNLNVSGINGITNNQNGLTLGGRFNGTFGDSSASLLLDVNNLYDVPNGFISMSFSDVGHYLYAYSSSVVSMDYGNRIGYGQWIFTNLIATNLLITTLTATGPANFSSSVTAGGLTLNGSGNVMTIPNGGNIVTPGNFNIFLGGSGTIQVNGGATLNSSGLSGAPVIATSANGLINSSNGIFSGKVIATNGLASYAPHTPIAVTVGASPFSFTNNTPIAIECYFSGGVAYTAIKNGVSGMDSSLVGRVYFVLQPTNNCTITYTVAPTFYTNAW